LIRASSSRGYREISTVDGFEPPRPSVFETAPFARSGTRKATHRSQCLSVPGSLGSCPKIETELAGGKVSAVEKWRLRQSTGRVPWLTTDGLSGGIFPSAGAGKRGGLENRGSGVRSPAFPPTRRCSTMCIGNSGDNHYRLKLGRLCFFYGWFGAGLLLQRILTRLFATRLYRHRPRLPGRVVYESLASFSKYCPIVPLNGRMSGSVLRSLPCCLRSANM